MSADRTTALGGWVEDDLVAVGTLVEYGDDLAWIGTIAVEASRRRQGFGTAIFADLLDRAADAAVVGLDATAMGKSMYADAGFRDVCGVTTYVGSLASAAADVAVERVTRPDHPLADEVYEFDRERTGIDREPHLELLLSEPAATLYVHREGAVGGYACTRPTDGPTIVGPTVASGPGIVDRLLEAVGVDLGPDPAMAIVPGHHGAPARLEAAGLSRRDTVTRMVRGSTDVALTGPHLWTGFGYEYG